MALACAALFTAGSLWIGLARDLPAGLAAAGMGLALAIAAGVLLRQALRHRAGLEERLRQLVAARPAGPRRGRYPRSVWIQRGEWWMSTVCNRPGPRFSNLCGMPAGPRTISPAAASMVASPTKNLARPATTTNVSS